MSGYDWLFLEQRGSLWVVHRSVACRKLEADLGYYIRFCEMQQRVEILRSTLQRRSTWEVVIGYLSRNEGLKGRWAEGKLEAIVQHRVRYGVLKFSRAYCTKGGGRRL